MNPIEILLIEDSPADARLAREALAEARVINELHHVETGEAGLAHLRESDTMPDLVLLDLNLPGIDGFDVLEEMRADPRLAPIPVVVLSTSSADRDVLEAYQLHANCFIKKPVDFRQFIEVVSAVQDFWVSIVRLPPKK